MDQSQNFLFFSIEEESFHFFSGISSDIHSYGQFRLNMEIDDEAPNIGIGREGIILNEEAHLQPQVVDGLGCQDEGGIEQAKRASNTIFKTTLSQYRKSIIDSVKGSKAAWILEQIKKIYHQKNMSIFPKLLGIVRQLSLSEEVTARWTLRSQNLTAKKKELFNRGKYSKKRLDELEKSIESMNFSLREPFFEEGLQKYWGNYKQMGKYSKSKEEVVNYLNCFKALLNENSPQAEIQHDEPSLRKCSSSSEASSQRISSFDP